MKLQYSFPRHLQETAQIANGLGEHRAAGTGEGAENKGGRFGPEKSTAK